MADHFSTTGYVARKEFRSFFATPAAYLFLGAFLAVTLFVFFWVETFFARNIADVRPLFQWLLKGSIMIVDSLSIQQNLVRVAIPSALLNPIGGGSMLSLNTIELRWCRNSFWAKSRLGF